MKGNFLFSSIGVFCFAIIVLDQGCSDLFINKKDGWHVQITCHEVRGANALWMTCVVSPGDRWSHSRVVFEASCHLLHGGGPARVNHQGMVELL